MFCCHLSKQIKRAALLPIPYGQLVQTARREFAILFSVVAMAIADEVTLSRDFLQTKWRLSTELRNGCCSRQRFVAAKLYRRPCLPPNLCIQYGGILHIQLGT